MILFNILFCTILLSTEKSETTLYGTEILKGKVSSIVMTDNYRCDSIVFSYDSDNQVAGYRIFENGKPGGHCEYSYSTNGIEQSCYDCNGKQLSCLCIEFDTNHNITTMQQYGYVYPDTANIKLLYKKSISYDAGNKQTGAYEYFRDGIPPYQYRYFYDTDGTITEERINANTGNVFTITKTINDKYGNVVKASETMPKDSPEWYSVTIDYIYDNQGNWTERKVNGNDPRQMDAVKNSKRRIHYLQ